MGEHLLIIWRVSTPEFAYHIGYEHKINNHNTISTKVGRSFRYPIWMKELG